MERTEIIEKIKNTETTIKEEITKARSLEDLLSMYDKARNQVREFEAGKSKEQLKGIEKEETEPYRSERKLKNAIEDWEFKAKNIYELRFYWSIGLILLVLGTSLYFTWSRWLGISLVITSFSEMIYWTSPTFFGSSSIESDRLLTQKTIFSLASLFFLLIIGKMLGLLKNDDKATQIS
jgi:hypothetical protein